MKRRGFLQALPATVVLGAIGPQAKLEASAVFAFRAIAARHGRILRTTISTRCSLRWAAAPAEPPSKWERLILLISVATWNTHPTATPTWSDTARTMQTAFQTGAVETQSPWRGCIRRRRR